MPTPLPDLLHRPLQIGTKTIASRLVLAPLSKLGNTAFRELVEAYGGCGLLFSEMCSARAVRHDVPCRTTGYMWRETELAHLVCQLYGDNPNDMAEAARRIEARGFFGVDINFGCSVATVCRHGCGAALLKSPDRAVAIVRAVRQAVAVPVFVKYRTGWKDDPSLAVDLARRFTDAGADCLTFHPRVAPDRRTRPPRWEYIGMVKDAVEIPVLGNGNVFDADDCRRMLDETGCDGISIGRLAATRPWIFARWVHGRGFAPSIYRDSMDRYVELLTVYFTPEIAMRRFNRHMAYFSANFRFGHTLYSAVCRATSLPRALDAFHDFYDTAPETTARPNITLLR
jgi:nifR3 family TIM-barrel protein